MKTHTLLSSLALVVSTTACGGSDVPTLDAEFAGATDAQLLRAQSAGVAGDAVIAMFFASNLAESGPSSCPTVAIDGDTATITGDCTTEGGTTIDGSVVIAGIEDEGDSTYTFDGLRLADEGDSWAFDGRVELREDRLDVELTATIAGIEATSSLALSVARGGTTTPADGSWVDVDGLGAAAVTGAWTYGDPPTGAMTLEGAGRVTFDFDGAQPGCVAYTIDGEVGGELCDGDEL